MRNVLLPRCFEAPGFIGTQPPVLGGSALYPLPPHFPTAQFHFFLHDLNDLGFLYAKLVLNRIKGRAVFPGHFDNPIYIPVGEFVLLVNFFNAAHNDF